MLLAVPGVLIFQRALTVQEVLTEVARTVSHDRIERQLQGTMVSMQVSTFAYQYQ